MFSSKKTIKCPVCDSVLGSWNEKFEASFICTECKWVFKWTPGDGVPKATHKLEPPRDRSCGCGGCGR